MKKALDYQLESACKDRLAELHLGFPKNIFAILDVRDHHIVLTLCFKLVRFFYIYNMVINNKIIQKV